MHTHGPWSASVTDTMGDKPALWDITDGKGVIAEVRSHNPDDARLIAAAPALLDAVRRLLRHVPADAGGCSLTDDVRRARAALSLAT